MLFTNWKTTLIGIITAVLNTVLPMLASGTVAPKDLAVSAGIAALGFVSKDWNTTGGTVMQ